jgi:hypothetical protein
MMTAGIRAALATALLTLSVPAAAGAAVLASTEPGAPAPTMALISTDTHEALPFAAIEVGQNVFDVTVGDKLYGLYVVAIAPNEVTLSDHRVLSASPVAQNP